MTVNELQNMSDLEYYSFFASIMRDAIYYNFKFYEWLLSHMYEIFDKEVETLEEMLQKDKKLKKVISSENPFYLAFCDFFKGTYTEGECLSLACVAQAFLSWKSDILQMEDYYEIRDMFVPFNLPISINVQDLNPLFKAVKDYSKDGFILLERNGKAVEGITVNDEQIVLALDELNFKEED